MEGSRYTWKGPACVDPSNKHREKDSNRQIYCKIPTAGLVHSFRASTDNYLAATNIQSIMQQTYVYTWKGPDCVDPSN